MTITDGADSLGGFTSVVSLASIEGELLDADIVRNEGVDAIATRGDYYAAAWDADVAVEGAVGFSATWYRGGTPAPVVNQTVVEEGRAGTCAYIGDFDEALAFMPGCPGGSSRIPNVSVTRVAVETGAGVLLYGRAHPLTSSRNARGAYALHAGIQDTGFFGNWLVPTD